MSNDGSRMNVEVSNGEAQPPMKRSNTVNGNGNGSSTTVNGNNGVEESSWKHKREITNIAFWREFFDSHFQTSVNLPNLENDNE